MSSLALVQHCATCFTRFPSILPPACTPAPQPLVADLSSLGLGPNFDLSPAPARLSHSYLALQCPLEFGLDLVVEEIQQPPGDQGTGGSQLCTTKYSDSGAAGKASPQGSPPCPIPKPSCVPQPQLPAHSLIQGIWHPSSLLRPTQTPQIWGRGYRTPFPNQGHLTRRDLPKGLYIFRKLSSGPKPSVPSIATLCLPHGSS